MSEQNGWDRYFLSRRGLFIDIPWRRGRGWAGCLLAGGGDKRGGGARAVQGRGGASFNLPQSVASAIRAGTIVLWTRIRSLNAGTNGGLRDSPRHHVQEPRFTGQGGDEREEGQHRKGADQRQV